MSTYFLSIHSVIFPGHNIEQELLDYYPSTNSLNWFQPLLPPSLTLSPSPLLLYLLSLSPPPPLLLFSTHFSPPFALSPIPFPFLLSSSCSFSSSSRHLYSSFLLPPSPPPLLLSRSASQWNYTSWDYENSWLWHCNCGQVASGCWCGLHLPPHPPGIWLLHGL